MVPLVVPVGAGSCLRLDLDPRFVVDDKILVGVVVGFFQMDVIEVYHVLLAKEQTDITVAVVLACAEHLRVENKTADRHVLQQRNVVRAAIWWLVLALFDNLAVNVAIAALL